MTYTKQGQKNIGDVTSTDKITDGNQTRTNSKTTKRFLTNSDKSIFNIRWEVGGVAQENYERSRQNSQYDTNKDKNSLREDDKSRDKNRDKGSPHQYETNRHNNSPRQYDKNRDRSAPHPYEKNRDKSFPRQYEKNRNNNSPRQYDREGYQNIAQEHSHKHHHHHHHHPHNHNHRHHQHPHHHHHHDYQEEQDDYNNESMLIPESAKRAPTKFHKQPRESTPATSRKLSSKPAPATFQEVPPEPPAEPIAYYYPFAYPPMPVYEQPIHESVVKQGTKLQRANRRTGATASTAPATNIRSTTKAGTITTPVPTVTTTKTGIKQSEKSVNLIRSDNRFKIEHHYVDSPDEAQRIIDDLRRRGFVESEMDTSAVYTNNNRK